MIEFTIPTDGMYAAGERHAFDHGLEELYVERGVAKFVTDKEVKAHLSEKFNPPTEPSRKMDDGRKDRMMHADKVSKK